MRVRAVLHQQIDASVRFEVDEGGICHLVEHSEEDRLEDQAHRMSGGRRLHLRRACILYTVSS